MSRRPALTAKRARGLGLMAEFLRPRVSARRGSLFSGLDAEQKDLMRAALKYCDEVSAWKRTEPSTEGETSATP